MFFAAIVAFNSNSLRRFCTAALRISPMFTSAMRTFPCVSRSTSDAREVRGVDAEGQPLGEDGDAVQPAVGQSLDDGADQRIHHLLEPDALPWKLLRNERERGTGCLADP